MYCTVQVFIESMLLNCDVMQLRTVELGMFCLAVLTLEYLELIRLVFMPILHHAKHLEILRILPQDMYHVLPTQEVYDRVDNGLHQMRGPMRRDEVRVK